MSHSTQNSASHPPESETRLGVLAHGAGIIASGSGLGFLPPALMWALSGKKRPFAAGHAIEALNFQLSLTLFVFAALAFLIGVVNVALFVIAFYFVPCVLIFGAFFSIMGAARASKGQSYRYPLRVPFFRQR